jgi:hypothetical protein
MHVFTLKRKRPPTSEEVRIFLADSDDEGLQIGRHGLGDITGSVDDGPGAAIGSEPG